MLSCKYTPNLVSIIIPLYNSKEYIEQCVRSLINQTYQDIEIIIVNDGSTDGFEDLAPYLSNLDKRIKLINKTNEGVSEARNTGLRAAKGEFCTFVDADDYVSKEFIAYMVDLIKYDGGADMALSLNCYTRKDEKQITEDKRKKIQSNELTALFLSPRLIVGCWNKIYRLKFIEENNLFFSKELFYGEGLHFITRYASLGATANIGLMKHYYYRRNNLSSATSKFSIEKLKNGELSLKMIKEFIDLSDPQINLMYNWHKCQFSMGIIVRLNESGQIDEYRDYYNTHLNEIKHSFKPLLKNKNISLYKRGLILGCAISPNILSLLYSIRKRFIQQRGIE